MNSEIRQAVEAEQEDEASPTLTGNPPLSIERLHALRDELKLKSHLFDAEMKSKWELLEKDLQLIQIHAKPLFRAAENSIRQIIEGLQRNHNRAS